MRLVRSRLAPGAVLLESHFGHLKIGLPTAGLSLAAVFGVMEAYKGPLGVAAYSVSGPTLEQVFLEVVGGRIGEEGEAV